MIDVEAVDSRIEEIEAHYPGQDLAFESAMWAEVKALIRELAGKKGVNKYSGLITLCYPSICINLYTATGYAVYLNLYSLVRINHAWLL